EPLGETERDERLTDLLPWLRGRLGKERRMSATGETSPSVVDFASANRAAELAELGARCPGHLARAKIKPLYVDWNPHAEDAEALKAQLDDGLAQYRKDYAAYHEASKHDDSPAMRGGDPTVVLIPGVGMIGWGKSKSESRVTAEFYKVGR